MSWASLCASWCGLSSEIQGLATTIHVPQGVETSNEHLPYPRPFICHLTLEGPQGFQLRSESGQNRGDLACRALTAPRPRPQ